MTEPVLQLQGLRELDRKLAALPRKVGFKTLRSAMMQAVRPMFLAAKTNANSTGIRNFDSGATAAAMSRWTKKISGTKAQLFIGPRSKQKRAVALWNAKHGASVSRLRHFHLVEFGSIRGPAQPFMRPAFMATRVAVARSFGKELGRAIDKAAKRAR